MKGRPWTDEEIKFLKENFNKMPARLIAKILDRPLSSIYHKAKKLGLKREKRNPLPKHLNSVVRKLEL